MFQYRCDKNHWWTDCSPEKPIFICCEQINSPKTGTKMCCLEKSVFSEAWSPEKTSQSFPVSCFWSSGFVPHKKWNVAFLVHQNKGNKNRYRKYFSIFFSPFHNRVLHLSVKKKKHTTNPQSIKTKNLCDHVYVLFSFVYDTHVYLS